MLGICTHVNKYLDLKYKYKYKYSGLNYKYKYFKHVLEYKYKFQVHISGKTANINVKNYCFITMCKAYSKVTHIKQQKYFHHLKRPGYNTEFLLYPRPLGDENIFAVL